MIFIQTIKNFLTIEECNKIINDFDIESQLSDSLVYEENGDINLNEKTRISKQNFVNIDGLTEKITKTLNDIIKIKGFKIDQLKENFQFTKYNENSHFNWHTDSYGYQYRFCTIVIQLNNEYTGGELLYKDENLNEIEFERGMGNMFIFNSSLEHKVTPIKSGIRYSLVNWLNLKEINDKKSLI